MSLNMTITPSGFQTILADGMVLWREGEKIGEVSVESLHEYWKNPSADNVEVDYIDQKERSEVLVDYFKKHVSPNDTIMELGCNVGRNLHYLYEAGYHNLTGIEINRKALELGLRYYRDMKNFNLICGEIGKELSKLKDNSVDVIFTMAVLEHIHPKEQHIFSNMARIARKYIITCEDEGAIYWRAFSYKYKELFEYLGLTELETSGLFCKNEVDATGDFTLTYRIFKK